MKLAIPLTAEGHFSAHFGCSEQVALFEVDRECRAVVGFGTATPPVGDCCGWAAWLGREGVDLLLAGGIGQGARAGMAAAGVEVLAGVLPDEPAELVESWLNGRLATGENTCEGHGHHHHHDHHHGHHHDHHHDDHHGHSDRGNPDAEPAGPGKST